MSASPPCGRLNHGLFKTKKCHIIADVAPDPITTSVRTLLVRGMDETLRFLMDLMTSATRMTRSAANSARAAKMVQIIENVFPLPAKTQIFCGSEISKLFESAND